MVVWWGLSWGKRLHSKKGEDARECEFWLLASRFLIGCTKAAIIGEWEPLWGGNDDPTVYYLPLMGEWGPILLSILIYIYFCLKVAIVTDTLLILTIDTAMAPLQQVRKGWGGDRDRWARMREKGGGGVGWGREKGRERERDVEVSAYLASRGCDEWT